VTIPARTHCPGLLSAQRLHARLYGDQVKILALYSTKRDPYSYQKSPQYLYPIERALLSYQKSPPRVWQSGDGVKRSALYSTKRDLYSYQKRPVFLSREPSISVSYRKLLTEYSADLISWRRCDFKSATQLKHTHYTLHVCVCVRVCVWMCVGAYVCVCVCVCVRVTKVQRN